MDRLNSSKEEALSFMCDLAGTARGMAIEGMGARAVSKADGSPVTEVDLSINDFVLAEVKRSWPNCGVLGEEASREVYAECVYVVDPLDGTAAYAAGLGVSSFVMAYVVRGETLAGVVDDPFTGTRFSAVLGGGAWCNGEALSLSGPSRSNMVAIEALRGGGIDDLALQAGLSGRGFYPVRYLSFANLAVRVASGAIAGAVFGKASSWDCLAPALIVSEAGGVVRSVSGGEFAGMSAREGVVMTNSEYTDAILQAVAEAC